MLRVRNLLLALGLSGAVLLTSCGKDEVSGSPLAYVPADSPYVLGNREGVPDAVMDSWWRRTEPLLAGYAPILEAAMLKIPETARGKHPLAHALLLEASKLRTRADFQALGLGGSSLMAFYGVGLTPVIRLELKDPAPLQAMIARAEVKAGMKAEALQLGSYQYYRVAIEKMELVVALGQGQLVVSFWPQDSSDASKQQILASAPPAQNILGTDRLQKIESKYGYQAYGSGYLDIVKIVDIFLQPSLDSDRALLAALKYNAPEMSAECRADIKQIVAKAPQMVFGATRFDGNGMESLSVLELDSSLAAELVPIAAQIPDVAKGAKWAGFSFGFNGQALTKFVENRAAAITANPFKCEKMAGLETELADMLQQLRGAGGFMNMAKGMAFRLDALEMQADNKAPTLIDAALLVASDTPQALIGMASMGMPQLAQLGLEPDGEAKALPLDGIPTEVSQLGTAWAVMSKQALAVRFATDDQGAGVKALINAPLTAPGTLLTYSFSGEIYRLLAKVMRSGIDPSTSTEEQEQMAKLFESYADIIGQLDNNILLTPRGVEIQQIMNMK